MLAFAPLIEVKHLSKRFGKTWALSDIDLAIEPGAIFGIIGLSGAGKSTLIRCLSSLEKPTSGQIWIRGQEIGKMQGKALRELRHRLGMIFQHFNLLTSRTAFGNIAYPLEITGALHLEKRVLELLDLVGLAHKKDSYPSQLSGGEKQRIGIARALAGHPDVLFCDEATSSLDPKTTREILALLKQLNQKLGLTIVLITHEMEVIKQICHQVAVLEQGKIVERGPVSQVFTDPQHATTKQFLQNTTHEIPAHFFKERSPQRRLLRLCFKGSGADQPLISQMIKRFDVDANILLGWIDSLQTVTVGNLIIELMGKRENMEQALHFLKEHRVHYEEIDNG